MSATPAKEAARLRVRLVVIDLPDSATFATVVADPRFVAALAIAILSGGARGFSGFGSALIYVPLMSAVYGPRIAAPSFLLVDFVTGLAFLPSVWRKAHWGDILPMAACGIFAAQFGTLILQYADPIGLRWVICVLVGMVVIVLVSGWRYHGRPRLAVTILVGLLAGTLGGAVQISGPPIILYWLGSLHDVAVVRANFITYFALFASGSGVIYLLHGLLTAEVLALAVILAPAHILAMWIGSLPVHRTPERVYRFFAYAMIVLSALLGMPLLDQFLR
jgi:uncharacterized membrane protein YfcA